MARTFSTMPDLGTTAPGFSLLDVVSGEFRALDDVTGEMGTVVMFICNHCPFVVHVNEELVRLANDYITRGIGFVAISANDAITHPEDGPEKMKEQAAAIQYPFPYLYDKSQAVAKDFKAACTPDFFVYNSALELVYRGQLDSSRPGNDIPVTGKDLRAVLDGLLKGRTISTEQYPSIGCGIKWRG
jgi:thiol-disulfide isomerase/thioredoxin